MAYDAPHGHSPRSPLDYGSNTAAPFADTVLAHGDPGVNPGVHLSQAASAASAGNPMMQERLSLLDAEASTNWGQLEDDEDLDGDWAMDSEEPGPQYMLPDGQPGLTDADGDWEVDEECPQHNHEYTEPARSPASTTDRVQDVLNTSPPSTERIPHAQSLQTLASHPRMPDTDAAQPFTTIEDLPDSRADLPPPLHFFAMIYALSSNMSVSGYNMFREIAQFMIEHPEQVKKLPDSLSTLEKNTRTRLPLNTLKSIKVDIDETKTTPIPRSDRKAYHFDMLEYAQRWLTDPTIMPYTHFGLADYTDQVTNHYEGPRWAESIMVTSGRYASITDATVALIPVLPLDCVEYKDPRTGQYHYGRIKGVYNDKRTQHASGTLFTINRLDTEHEAEIAAFEEEALDMTNWTDPVAGRNLFSQHKLFTEDNKPELVLNEDDILVPLRYVIKHIWVHFLDHLGPQERLEDSLLPFQHEVRFCVKRIFYRTNTNRTAIRTVYKRRRLTAENELRHYGRKWIYQHVLGISEAQADQEEQSPLYSLPYTMFFDDFGFYRRTYNALSGLYVTPAAVDIRIREKPGNSSILMLGPFGTSEEEIARCLSHDLHKMHYPTPVTLADGTAARVVSFPLAITGDMPQQQVNAACRGPRADYPCRYCMISRDELSDTTFDSCMLGRYSEHTSTIRANIQQLQYSNAQERAHKSFGLCKALPPFRECFPVLDTCVGFPIDPYHCELRLCGYWHTCFVNSMLSSAGKEQYLRAWEQATMPYGWSTPQNPVTHKGSFTFAEQGRVAILLPFILMDMFSQDMSGTKSLLPNAQRRLREQFGHRITETLIENTHRTAQILHMIFAKSQPRDTDSLHKTIIEHRQMLTKFFSASPDPKNRNWGNIPNIHFGTHYMADTAVYGTPRMAQTMTGEQKHKVFKAHALNTNMRENDHVLLKKANTTQTVRLLSNGAFAASHPDLTEMIRLFNEKCPTMRIKMVGRDDAALYGENTQKKHKKRSYVPTGNLTRMSTCTETPQRRILRAIRIADLKEVHKTLQRTLNEHHIQQHRVRIQYFCSCAADIIGTATRFRLKKNSVGSFVYTKKGRLVFIHRILSTHFAQQNHIMLCAYPVARRTEYERIHAPYEVRQPLIDDLVTGYDVLLLSEIRAEFVHAIPFDTDHGRLYYINPYLPDFL